MVATDLVEFREAMRVLAENSKRGAQAARELCEAIASLPREIETRIEDKRET